MWVDRSANNNSVLDMLQIPQKIISSLTFIFIIFLTFLTVFTVSEKPIKASNVVFQDNFDDGINDGWTVTYQPNCDTSPTWVIVNGKYGTEINETSCDTRSIPGYGIIPEQSDYKFEVDISFPGNIKEDRNILFKYKDDQCRYGLHFYDDHFGYERINGTNSVSPPSGNVYYYSFQSNEEYHFTFYVTQSYVRILIDNNFDVTIPEPNEPFPNSTIALRATSGSVGHSKVWFDNVKVTLLPSVPFDLPIYYEGRDSSGNYENFASTFWNKMTAVFDHERKGQYHIPFTGDKYKNNDCKKGDIGIECYNGHKGTDFDDDNSPNDTFEDDVYPAGNGQVVYSSEYTQTKNGEECVPEKGGYGCVLIIRHNTSNNETLYTLYAHLKDIIEKYRNASSDNPVPVIYTDHIAEMGNTGCKKCGIHLHFGVMKEVTPDGNTSIKKMTKSDWQVFLEEASIEQQENSSPKHYCTYNAPNGSKFAFIDPSGWNPENETDPWFESCNIESPYLWKDEIGSPTIENNQLQDFLEPLKNFLTN